MSEQQDSVQEDPCQDIITNQDTSLHVYQEYQISPQQPQVNLSLLQQQVQDHFSLPDQQKPDHYLISTQDNSHLVSTQGNHLQTSHQLHIGSGASHPFPSYPRHQISTASQQQQYPRITYNSGYMTSSGHSYQLAAGNPPYDVSPYQPSGVPPSWGCTFSTATNPSLNPMQSLFFMFY